MLQELMGRVLGSDETARGAAAALAPLSLLSTGLYDDALGYVLRGGTPEVMAGLASAGTTDVDRLLDQPGHPTPFSTWVSGDLVERVAAQHKAWTVQKGIDARRRFYTTGSVEQVVRFARVLSQVCETAEIPGVPEWLSLLLHDVGHLGTSRRHRSGSGSRELAGRWTPSVFEEAATDGGVPADDAARTVLLGVVHRSTPYRSWRVDPRAELMGSAAFGVYCDQHVGLLVAIIPTLAAAGKEGVLERFGGRIAAQDDAAPEARHVPRDRYARIVAALAVDPAKGVRVAALKHLASLADHRQVELLAPGLTTAPSGRLGEVVTRLVALDGGTAACEAASAAQRDANGKVATGQTARVRLLEQAVERARALETPADETVLDLPAWEPLPDVELDDAWLAQLRTDVERATVEAREHLAEMKKRWSGDPKNWALKAAQNNADRLRKLTDKDFEVLRHALSSDSPSPRGDAATRSPLLHWLADRRRDPFAGQGLMLHLRLQALANAGRQRQGNRNTLLWSLRGHLDQLTDLRQLHEALERIQVEDGEQLISDLVLHRWWGQREIPTSVSWPWFAERPQLLQNALQGGDSRGDQTAMALAVLREFPAVPSLVLSHLTALALGAGKTHRVTAQQILEAHAGARGLAEQALTDTKSEVRASAATWLQRIGDPASVPALRATLAKERREATRAALLSALEALGDDISSDLAPAVLQAEAAKGLGAKLPASLGWFPFDQLPDLRWAAACAGERGETVPRDVVRWWVVLATKLKAPSGEGLIARYVGLLEPASRAELGSFVLRAWVAQDTRHPSVEHSREYADTYAQTRWDNLQSAIKRNPEYYADQAGQSVDDFWKWLYRSDQAVYLGSATQEKGLLALTVGMPGAELAKTAQHYFAAHKGRRAQAEYLVRALAANGDRAAVQQLLAVSRRFKQRTVQETAGALAQDIADRNGWDSDQLADRTVQTAGFDDDGILRLDLGGATSERVVTGRLTEAFTLELRNPAGKVVKALPAQRASDDDEAYAEAKRQLKESRAELKAVVALQTQRFAEAMVTGRTWSVADWHEFVLGHPLMSRLAARLVWAAQLPDAAVGSRSVTFRPGDGGALIGVDDEDVTLPSDARVALVHAVDLGDDAGSGAHAWSAHLADYEITPLFDQGFGAEEDLSAEALPDLPGDATVIETRKGWLSDSYTIRGRATKLGYSRSQAEDAGWFTAYRKEYPTLDLTVEIEFTGAFLPEENITAAVQHLVFRRTGTWDDRGRFALKDVPRALLAVSYRDYVSVADGGAFDPDWEKKSEY